ncbi:MAG: hypothetical protein L3K26_20265, partial [Candidatus Hydrogenedentes bacterium]|nr:hypothetical protein [Candidatus Hydrogenedentota bacterium]
KARCSIKHTRICGLSVHRKTGERVVLSAVQRASYQPMRGCRFFAREPIKPLLEIDEGLGYNFSVFFALLSVTFLFFVLHFFLLRVLRAFVVNKVLVAASGGPAFFVAK